MVLFPESSAPIFSPHPPTPRRGWGRNLILVLSLDRLRNGGQTMINLRVTSALAAATVLTLVSYAQAQSLPPEGELHVT